MTIFLFNQNLYYLILNKKLNIEKKLKPVNFNNYILLKFLLLIEFNFVLIYFV